MNYLDFFGSRRGEPIFVNTVFGGIGDVINTPELLAPQIGIADSNDIKLFEIDSNNNIKCSINVNYDNVTDNYKSNNTNFYYDFEGNILVFNQRFFEISSPLERVISLSNGSLDVQCFRLTQLTHAILPNIIDTPGLDGGYFGQTTTLKRVYLPKWADYTDFTYPFYFGDSINTGSAIWYFHKDMGTINNGSAHASILQLLNENPFINEARYVKNTDKPNPVTDLSVSNIASNSVQLNFTPPPINTNANDFYYVYLDWNGISFKYKYSTLHKISAFYDEITGSGDTITGLPNGTEISVQVQTVDFYHNVSGYSNKVTFTTL